MYSVVKNSLSAAAAAARFASVSQLAVALGKRAVREERACEHGEPLQQPRMMGHGRRRVERLPWYFHPLATMSAAASSGESTGAMRGSTCVGLALVIREGA